MEEIECSLTLLKPLPALEAFSTNDIVAMTDATTRALEVMLKYVTWMQRFDDQLDRDNLYQRKYYREMETERKDFLVKIGQLSPKQRESAIKQIDAFSTRMQNKFDEPIHFTLLTMNIANAITSNRTLIDSNLNQVAELLKAAEKFFNKVMSTVKAHGDKDDFKQLENDIRVQMHEFLNANHVKMSTVFTASIWANQVIKSFDEISPTRISLPKSVTGYKKDAEGKWQLNDGNTQRTNRAISKWIKESKTLISKDDKPVDINKVVRMMDDGDLYDIVDGTIGKTKDTLRVLERSINRLIDTNKSLGQLMADNSRRHKKPEMINRYATAVKKYLVPFERILFTIVSDLECCTTMINFIDKVSTEALQMGTAVRIIKQKRTLKKALED